MLQGSFNLPYQPLQSGQNHIEDLVLFEESLSFIHTRSRAIMQDTKKKLMSLIEFRF